MSKILVAGAGGFIGGHLIQSLIDDKIPRENIVAVDIKPPGDWWQEHPGVQNIVADLRGADACNVLTEGVGTIYNLAADMGGMGFIENNKAACMLSVLINTHLLMGARANKVPHYFYASSACVYAADRQTRADLVALREEDAYPALPEDGYGWEKLFSERMCRHFHEDFGIDIRVARFHNVYGPRGSWNGGREKAPAAICRKVSLAKATGEHFIDIWGDGEQTRSFMFIDDCISGIHRICKNNVKEPINLGSSEMVTINQLVSIAEEIAGIKCERRYNLSAPKGVRGRNSDNTKIKELLGWEPTTTLREGLEETFHWIDQEMNS
jgi:GDP-D-mannose 3',5'-epimerase